MTDFPSPMSHLEFLKIIGIAIFNPCQIEEPKYEYLIQHEIENRVQEKELHKDLEVRTFQPKLKTAAMLMDLRSRKPSPASPFGEQTWLQETVTIFLTAKSPDQIKFLAQEDKCLRREEGQI
jgi:hypothetical protein